MNDGSFSELAASAVVLVLAVAAMVYLWRAIRGPNRSGYLFRAGLSLAALVVGANALNWLFPPPKKDEWAATVSAIGSQPTQPASPAKSSTLSSSQEFVWIRANQRLIAKKLKDPSSAKFGDDYISYKTGAPVVCGSVNARNSFGAYAGAERYIGGGDTVGVFLASEVADFDKLWGKVCR